MMFHSCLRVPCLSALDAERYEVIQVGITLDGDWLTGENTLEAFEKRKYPKS